MLKPCISIIIFLFCQTSLLAQTYEWGKSEGLGGFDRAITVTEDKDGDIYTLSVYKDSFHLSNVVVQKLNTDGELTWSREYGDFTDEGWNLLSTEMAIDDSGNVYVYGQFKETIDFDPGVGEFLISSEGIRDCFIQKLDTDGNFLWAKSFGDIGSEYAGGMALDASGNIYMCGRFSFTVDFDPGDGVALLSTDYSGNAFILKLDSEGNFIWVKKYGGEGMVNAKSMTADDLGNVYTVGYFPGTIDLDPEIDVFSLSSAGGFDFFIQKLDASGNFLWANGNGGSHDDFANDIALDDDNVYITGGFRDTVDFDPGDEEFLLAVHSGGGYLLDAFVQKLDTEGNFVWAKSYGGTSNEHGNTISTDESGYLHVAGQCGYDVDFDPGPGVTLLSSKMADTYIQKLDIDGDFIWARAGWSIGIGASSRANGLEVDSVGNVYLVGDYSVSVDLDPSGDTDIFVNEGVRDVYIEKLSVCESYVISDSITNCDSYLWEENGEVYVIDTIVYKNYVSITGCDSTRKLILNIEYSDTVVNNIEKCYSYLWDEDGIMYTNDTVVSYIYENSMGCDSIRKLILHIAYSDTVVNNVDGCTSYLWDEDGVTYTNDTVVSYVYENGIGCDSTVRLDLSILETTYGIDSISACNSYSWIDGLEYFEDNFVATHVLENAMGCDSIVTLNLTISTMDVSVTNTEPILTANEDMAVYQWLNCLEDMTIIPGETNQEFTALSNGSYAVEITTDGCLDTSECIVIDDLGLGGLDQQSVRIYPNPTTGFVMFELVQNAEVSKIEVRDLSGKIVYQDYPAEFSREIDLSYLSDGIYTLNIWDRNGVYFKRIILSR